MKACQRSRCLVACAMAETHFENGDEDEGLLAYNLALEAQDRTTTPLSYLETFVACEVILRKWIWESGTADGLDDEMEEL